MSNINTLITTIEALKSRAADLNSSVSTFVSDTDWSELEQGPENAAMSDETLAVIIKAHADAVAALDLLSNAITQALAEAEEFKESEIEQEAYEIVVDPNADTKTTYDDAMVTFEFCQGEDEEAAYFDVYYRADEDKWLASLDYKDRRFDCSPSQIDALWSMVSNERRAEAVAFGEEWRAQHKAA